MNTMDRLLVAQRRSTEGHRLMEEAITDLQKLIDDPEARHLMGIAGIALQTLRDTLERAASVHVVIHRRAWWRRWMDAKPMPQREADRDALADLARRTNVVEARVDEGLVRVSRTLEALNKSITAYRSVTIEQTLDGDCGAESFHQAVRGNSEHREMVALRTDMSRLVTCTDAMRGDLDALRRSMDRIRASAVSRAVKQALREKKQ